MRSRFLCIITGAIFLVPFFAQAIEYTSTNFRVDSPAVLGGAEEGSSASFQLEGNLPFIEERDVSSSNFRITSGSDNGVSFVAPVLYASSGPDFAQVRLSWTAAIGASSASYEVGVSSNLGGPYTYSISTSGLTATVSGLSFSQRYYFVVRTYDGAVLQASLSNEASAFPQAFPASSGGGGGSGGGSGPAPTPIEYPGPGVFVVFPAAPATDSAGGGLAGVIDTIIGAITSIFNPPYVVGQIPLSSIVPRVAQPSLSGRWALIPEDPVQEFVFRPLPAELRKLASQLPQLNDIFFEVGITRFNDLKKLKNVSLKIPGLSDALALPTVKISGGSLALPRQLAIDELTPELKSKFPSGILFTKFAGGLVDVQPHLRLTRTGETEQVIRAVTGRTLNLSIKPEFPAQSVTGYLLFKTKSLEPEKNISEVGRWLGARIARAAALPEISETALVVDVFIYADPNNDGIYTAQITAPVATGEYEVVTLINYQDASRGTKLIRMITLVDPEGYIYELKDGKETRIPDARVILEQLNPETNRYEEWSANKYGQTNPVITDLTGQYAFLVPPGMYQISVEASGYKEYRGRPFAVEEGRGVHENLRLERRFNLFEDLDLPTLGILVVLLLVLYNFHRDKMRDSKLVPSPESGQTGSNNSRDIINTK